MRDEGSVSIILPEKSKILLDYSKFLSEYLNLVPVNSEFSGSKLKVYLTFSDFGRLSRDNPSPLTQIFGNAFVERD